MRRRHRVQIRLRYGISLGPQPVGVQCPITSSLHVCEFSGYWDWLCFPRLPPVLVSIASFSSPTKSRLFLSTLLRLPLDFIHVSSLGPVWYENLSGVVSCPENSNINIDGLDSVVIGSRDP